MLKIFLRPMENGKLDKKGEIFRNIAVLAVLIGICTAVSMVFRHLGASEANIVMVYLLGILLFSYLAGSYVCSFFASLVGVLSYNFFFTEPYFTFLAYSPDYPFTFIIMFCVGLFTSMLTIKIKHETLLAEEREERIRALYHIGRILLGVKSSTNLAEVSAAELSKQFSASVIVQFFDSAGTVRNQAVKGPDVFSCDKERIVCYETLQSGNPCGRGTKLFSDALAYYLPIVSQSGVVGIIGVSLPEQKTLTGVQMEFLDTIATQIAVVLERETLYQQQEETQVQIQRERLRSDMLRTVSHDLRTPLTGIMGSASTVIDNFNTLNDDTKIEFLNNIYSDASWLNDLVESILNITRFDEGRIKLNINQEAAEEIVAEAVNHVKKRTRGHTIVTNMPSEIILLQADGVLITQVLINLIDNAVNYTPEGSTITVSFGRTENAVVFEVKDNGFGISEEDFPHIFERFYSRRGRYGGTSRGFGLGLSLCKSIVEAHGGEIYASNIKPHGASFKFYIPAKEGKKNEASDINCG